MHGSTVRSSTPESFCFAKQFGRCSLESVSEDDELRQDAALRLSVASLVQSTIADSIVMTASKESSLRSQCGTSGSVRPLEASTQQTTCLSDSALQLSDEEQENNVHFLVSPSDQSSHPRLSSPFDNQPADGHGTSKAPCLHSTSSSAAETGGRHCTLAFLSSTVPSRLIRSASAVELYAQPERRVRAGRSFKGNPEGKVRGGMTTNRRSAEANLQQHTLDLVHQSSSMETRDSHRSSSSSFILESCSSVGEGKVRGGGGNMEKRVRGGHLLNSPSKQDFLLSEALSLPAELSGEMSDLIGKLIPASLPSSLPGASLASLDRTLSSASLDHACHMGMGTPQCSSNANSLANAVATISRDPSYGRLFKVRLSGSGSCSGPPSATIASACQDHSISLQPDGGLRSLTAPHATTGSRCSLAGSNSHLSLFEYAEEQVLYHQVLSRLSRTQSDLGGSAGTLLGSLPVRFGTMSLSSPPYPQFMLGSPQANQQHPWRAEEPMFQRRSCSGIPSSRH